MEIEQKIADEIEFLWNTKNFSPEDDLRPEDEVVGMLPDNLKPICVAYLNTQNGATRFSMPIRRAFWKALSELFPEAGVKVNSRKLSEGPNFNFGIRKNWQVVIFPYELPSVRVH